MKETSMKINKKTSVISCPACENPVSSEAVACPHCGHPVRGGHASGINMKDPVHFIGVVVAAFIVLIFVAGIIVGCIALLTEQ